MLLPTVDELKKDLQADAKVVTQLGAEAIMIGDHASKDNDLFGVTFASAVLKAVNKYLPETYEDYDVCNLTPEVADIDELLRRRLTRNIQLLQAVEGAQY